MKALTIMGILTGGLLGGSFAHANLICVSDDGLNQLKIKEVQNPGFAVKVVATAQKHETVYFGKILSQQPGRFSNTVYQLQGYGASPATLTVSQIPRCGRCAMESEGEISAELDFGSVVGTGGEPSVIFSCYVPAN